ncbi:GNAT family N-acetyltransferase [Microbacter margulisiae]|uniref:GNAT superfamily N-acetyltransferase n=1 Tax=Microbacter margulisiae TaxID=1350067 RepID=A0A7W5H3B3_9PORP|nr:GNAT family N-acetyltransferase [Microbacter margulisiae]MBB3188434.1 GNAT superfamily N-acetyltransferase [Microbacter margulisiae]
MKITIRKATQDDYPAILEMIKALAVFEKAGDKVSNTVEQMIEEQAFFRCLIAENDQHQPVAIALYFFAYYTWVGKSLYLDDLYVKETYRKQGIATQLLRAVFDVAREENCHRVRWQVLNWNENALALYRKCGATIDSEWSNCDFDREGIVNFSI